MYSERLISVCVATLMCLSACLLGMGQRDPSLPIQVIIGMFTAVVVTDFLGIIVFNRLLSNLITILVLVYVFSSFQIRFEGVDRIIGIATLLVYLELVMMFRKKSLRAYWQLILLSFLQVVVAGAFPQGVLFGFLTLGYMFFMLGTVTLLVWHHHAHEAYLDSSDRQKKMKEDAFFIPAPIQMPCHQTFTGLSRRDESRDIPSSTASTVNVVSLLDGAWLRMVVSAGLRSLLIGLIIFFFTPRTGAHAFRGLTGQQAGMIGFKDSIRLGELGERLKNTQEVMRVDLKNMKTDIPVKVPIIYLRGVVLNHYQNGMWSHKVHPFMNLRNPSLLGRIPSHRFPFLGSSPRRQIYMAPEKSIFSDESLTRMGFQVEPCTGNQLFGVWPFYSAGSDVENNQFLSYDMRKETLERNPEWIEYQEMPFHYELVTQVFHDGVHCNLAPHYGAVDILQLLQIPGLERTPRSVFKKRLNGRNFSLDDISSENDFYSEKDVKDLKDEESSMIESEKTSGSETVLPAIFRKASSWLEMLNAQDIEYSAYDVALHIERQLRDSGEYHYSLKSQSRTPGIDPVEDFIRDHHYGHCEYFASALALMLRSCNIPARVVVGYACEERVPLGDFYVIRHSQAHAWVEVYLDYQSIPEHVRARLPWGVSSPLYADGLWLRLDATPSSDEELTMFHKLVNGSGSFFRTIDTLWSTYVVRMDRASQYQSIYSPVAGYVEKKMRSIFNYGAWSLWWKDIVKWFHQHSFFSWFFLVLISVLIFLVFRKKYFRIWLKMPVFRWWVSRHGVSVQDDQETSCTPVLFYEKVEKMLGKINICRKKGETPLEFTSQTDIIIGTNVRDVAWAYYMVRFGHQKLDPGQIELVRMRTDQLQDMLAHQKDNR